MPIEQIAPSNNKQQEDPKMTLDKKKTAESNDSQLNLDEQLGNVDEQRFNKFKNMVDYIKKNGGEYGDEYNDIMDRVIKPFEKQIQDILNKSKVNKESNDLSTMSDEELANEANERMEDQPTELNQQQELLSKITGNGSPEEINKLNEIINENMVDVQSFWEKVSGQSQKSNIVPNLFDNGYDDYKAAA